MDGVWISNCFELKDADDGSFITYSIDECTFSNGNYTLRSVGYIDDNCTTPDGTVDDYFGEFYFKEELISTDGKIVNHVSMTQEFDEMPEGMDPFTFEVIIYLNDNKLYFGDYNNGDNPEINYSSELKKQ